MRRTSRGFTLIELMIVVVVAAIIGAVAMPAYQQQMRKSRRAEAREAMLQLQSAQERWRSTNVTYAGTVAALGITATTSGGNYTISLSGASATGYTATATAQAKQSGDTGCTTMTITVAGNATTYGPSNACWGL